MNAVVKENPKPTKLDLGCGPNPKQGFTGVDAIKFNDDHIVFDLREGPWPFESDSIEESHCAHFLEHLTNFNDKWERVRFFNELYRITQHQGKCTLIFPHWASNRFYGDPTHKEPFSEMGFYYLDRAWRLANAPHTDIKHNPNGYDCNWNCTWGYSMHQELTVRNADYQNYAMKFYKEACQDMHVTMTANKK